MTEPNEQYAYFTITDSFDPAEISQRVGVVASESWRQGDLNPLTRYERKLSCWCLHSRLGHEHDLEVHIRDVLSQLDQKRAVFQQLSKEFRGCMQLVGYFYAGYPGLHFETDIVEGLARYSLSVDFDFYYLYSHARKAS